MFQTNNYEISFYSSRKVSYHLRKYFLYLLKIKLLLYFTFIVEDHNFHLRKLIGYLLMYVINLVFLKLYELYKTYIKWRLKKSIRVKLHQSFHGDSLAYLTYLRVSRDPWTNKKPYHRWCRRPKHRKTSHPGCANCLIVYTIRICFLFYGLGFLTC